MALGHSDGSPEEPESDSDDYVPSEYDVNSDDEPPEEGPGDLIDVSSDKLVQKTLVQPGHGFIRPGRYDAVRVTRAKFMTGGGYRLLALGQTLEGSFSAVWTATIATKYSFCSIFRDLQDFHNSAPLESRNFANFEFGAVRRSVESFRARKTLKDEYLIVKIGVDTAENEASKV